MKLFVLSLAALTFAGCASNSKPASPETAQAKPAKAAQPDTGRIALQRMAVPAHMWAADVQPVHLDSQPTQTADGSDGKATVWRSSWASATKSTAKDFSWSGSDDPDAPPRGLSPGGEDSWTPTNTSMHAFDLGYLKVDSDKAEATAKAKLTGKSAVKPVKYALTFDTHKQQLLWRITFGATERATTIDIDATTGSFVRTER